MYPLTESTLPALCHIAPRWHIKSIMDNFNVEFSEPKKKIFEYFRPNATHIFPLCRFTACSMNRNECVHNVYTIVHLCRAKHKVRYTLRGILIYMATKWNTEISVYYYLHCFDFSSVHLCLYLLVLRILMLSLIKMFVIDYAWV